MLYSCVCLVLCIYFFLPFFFIFYCTLLHFPMSLSIFLTFHLMQQVLRLNIRLDFTQLVKWIYFSPFPFLSSFFSAARSRQFFFLAFYSISCSDFHFFIFLAFCLLLLIVILYLNAFMSQTFIIFNSIKEKGWNVKNELNRRQNKISFNNFLTCWKLKLNKNTP